MIILTCCLLQENGTGTGRQDLGSLQSFQTIATFIKTKNVLEELCPLASKFQKRDQDIYEPYGMVDSIKNITVCIDGNFSLW